ncbi:MAG: SAM-dependent methyltransferase [uncultured Sphingosinicella sp.]|uniref:SAM-dependent methyltransferase n=1 Tax=uncultured Sphingosinicella sp. TaxID=478748 RepID=A0A6J4U8H3_9SPHN|nr:class I SAM-dependent methyltransferase [uncultured Sphingosinicella sp.]CAA9543212.1 MAG: SAM-dependent methyltransferase [uncultured Sphingosinicella sp.]
MHERIIGLYEENAGAWDEARGRELDDRQWFDRFTSLLPPGASVLDLGCGSGEPVARHLIESGYRVTGVDSSPSLIAMCRERFLNGEWLVGDMRGLDLGRRFDGILAWHSFFHLHFDAQRAMFPRFATHAASGAALMFTSGPQHGEAIGDWQGEPLYHASLDPDEYRGLLHTNDFGVVSFQAGEPATYGPSVWIARKVS